MILDARTLVLDDDGVFVDVVARCLRHTVREVDQTVDCDRALELFELHRHPVVVLDLRMPKMSGFEVMQRIHEIEPHTPVIIVTGYSSVDSAITAVNQHAFGFLRKPFDNNELRRLVIAAVSSHHDRHGLGPHTDDRVIESLYQEVTRLSAALERSPDDPALQTAYRDSFARLRGAQAREAELASRAFRDNLALPKGMGYSSIEAARRVLDRDKGSS
ncbi:MAG TPA: response regulator [Kofleriaceae bacterium]|nr:response regulator [Kofleriaceae bacterium]